MTKVVLRPIPAGYKRLRVTKRLEYARTVHEVGEQIFVEELAAARFIRDRVAVEETPEAERESIWTTCPRCQRSWWIPAEPRADERWTQCQCGHGWLR